MRNHLSALVLVILAGCGGPSDQPEAKEKVELPVPSGPPAVEPEVVPDTSTGGALRWESVTGGEGTMLRLVGGAGRLLMSLSCPAGARHLAVTVPAFTTVNGEERLVLSLGMEPVTLVANMAGQKGVGISAEGAVPDDFSDLVEGAERIGAVYGFQKSGPHAAPPEQLRKAFAAACEARR